MRKRRNNRTTANAENHEWADSLSLKSAALHAVGNTMFVDIGRHVLIFQTEELRDAVECFLERCLCDNSLEHKRCLYVLAVETDEDLLRDVGAATFYVFHEGVTQPSPTLHKNVVVPLLRDGESRVVFHRLCGNVCT